ncbi:MAG TPA: histidine kinase dimerization/phospho-acceptor domain-containing protein [Micromonosporaceae bacterium]|nr:histidine kinase dimerization/phospho-acceptor domain-containing protein [Micromonosporaceae bacterium]
MTGEPRHLRSPLDRRLLAAFVLVALSSVVVLTGSVMVWPGRGMGPGGMHSGPGGAVVEAPVLVAGEQVGTVRLAFRTGAAGGRAVAWSWVLGAALVALATALVVSWYVTGRLARPLATLAAAARRFAAGDRSARAGVRGPGELGEVASAFNAMADEVVRAETVRRQVAADVAHELRTPLAGLQAGLEELRDGLREPDPQRLAALHDQALRLGRVVDDLADLSAAEAAALSLRPAGVDLAGIAGAALAAQRPQLDAAGLRVDADLARPTRTACTRRSPTCWPTRSATAGRETGSRYAPASTVPAPRSPSPTPGPASPPRSCRTSSTGSGAAGWPARSPAPASGWRWYGSWSPPTVARSPPRRPRAAGWW